MYTYLRYMRAQKLVKFRTIWMRIEYFIKKIENYVSTCCYLPPYLLRNMGEKMSLK